MGPRLDGDMGTAAWGDLMPEQHPLRSVPVSFYGAGGITVLGTPVDAPGHVPRTQAAWGKAVSGATKILTALRGLPDGQIRHCISRFCLDACKVQHLLRTTPQAAAEVPMHELSSALLQTVTDIVGRPLLPIAWA